MQELFAEDHKLPRETIFLLIRSRKLHSRLPKQPYLDHFSWGSQKSHFNFTPRCFIRKDERGGQSGCWGMFLNDFNDANYNFRKSLPTSLKYDLISTGAQNHFKVDYNLRILPREKLFLH